MTGRKKQRLANRIDDSHRLLTGLNMSLTRALGAPKCLEYAGKRGLSQCSQCRLVKRHLEFLRLLPEIAGFAASHCVPPTEPTQMYSLAAEAFARGEGRRRDASSGSQNPGRHRLMLNGSPDPGAFLGPNLGPLSES